MKLKHKQRRSLLGGIMLGGAAMLSMTSASIHAMVQEESSSVSTQQQASSKSGRLIIKYKNSAPESLQGAMSSASMDKMSAMAGVELKHKRQLATGAQLLEMDKNLSTIEVNAAIAKLMKDPNVEYVEEDLLLQPMATPTDPGYNQQWHYFEAAGGLNLPPAWDITQGQGVVVAVIDTGFRPHSDLNANLLPGYDMIADITTAQDGNGRDSDASDPGDWQPAGACPPPNDGPSNSSWHGTHVAGTVAAVTNNNNGVAGVAYRAKVVPVRALGRCGGFTSDIADGMIWAAGGNVPGVPANANPAQVLNLSLGGGGACGATQQAAINTARSLGATVVVAAGNSGINAANATPANCSGVITVAAVARDGGRTFYSNFGNVVDVAAPGGETSGNSSNGVLSTLNNGTRGPGDDAYAFYQGTSMAAPHVAGAVALMYSVNPNITPTQVESILKNTARPFPASCSGCGAGIVDANAAVLAANGGGSGGNNVLTNGDSKNGLSGAANSQTFYTLEVPAGASNLSFDISGGTGDADLYVRFGSQPTTATFDCRPFRNGNNETCNISNVQAGTYHVMLRGFSAYSNVSLVANHN